MAPGCTPAGNLIRRSTVLELLDTEGGVHLQPACIVGTIRLIAEGSGELMGRIVSDVDAYQNVRSVMAVVCHTLIGHNMIQDVINRGDYMAYVCHQLEKSEQSSMCNISLDTVLMCSYISTRKSCSIPSLSKRSV